MEFFEKLDFSEENRITPVSKARWSDPPIEGIRILNGQSIRIYAGSEIHLEFIEIQSGGELQIENGRRAFTYIRVKEYFKNHGTVRVVNFRSGGGSFSETAPDGELLEVYLEEVNRGGDGGNGSKMHCSYGGTNRPGRGARGTSDWGGGGGGGVGWSKPHRGQCIAGADAGNWTGARSSGPVPGGDGGDGSRRGRSVNGGYLYLRSDGTFESPGLLDFNGTVGQNGLNGDVSGGLGTGGGGGGAPGGQGGVFALKCRDIRGEINFRASGGAGGQPGKGAIAYGNQAEDGKAGEQGYDGELVLL